MAGRESISRRVSRRDATLRPAGAGIAAGSSRLSAQTASAHQIPSWNTELRQLAPNVYAYTQASGPGIDNASLSNAGVIVATTCCRFSNWTNPERIVWNTMPLYAEFNGSLTPEMDVPGTNRAMDEYNARNVNVR